MTCSLPKNLLKLPVWGLAASPPTGNLTSFVNKSTHMNPGQLLTRVDVENGHETGVCVCSTQYFITLK